MRKEKSPGQITSITQSVQSWKSMFTSQVCVNKMFIRCAVLKPLIVENLVAEQGIWFIIPCAKFPVRVLKVNNVEPNASRAVTILLHGGKIAVKFTSQQLYVGREILYQLLDLQFSTKAKINNYCLKELQKVQTYDPKPCIYELWKEVVLKISCNPNFRFTI